MRINGNLDRFCRDERGAIALIVALLLTVLMGFLALGIDLGALYFHQKTLQTRADLAAISAVTNLQAAPDIHARDTIQLNGMDRDAMTSITYSHYSPNLDLTPGQRLAPRTLAADDVNAVTVQLSEVAPLFFARSFMPQDSTQIGARATAARFDLASFGLGSRVAGLQGGLLNVLLGEALGTSVAFDLVDYNALADARVDLLSFSDALANRVELAAGNYKDVLNTDVQLADIAGAILDTGAVSGSTDVLTTILSPAGSSILNTSRLISVDGDDVSAQLEDVLPEITVTVLDLLMASIDVVNANRVIKTNLNVSVPNVTSTKLELVVGERQAYSGWITIGERKASIHTAQVRLRLNVELSPGILSGLNGGLDIASVTLPLYLEVASATATLSELNCAATQPSDVVARFDTGFDPMDNVNGTHLADLFLGSFTPPDFQDTSTTLDPSDLSHAKLLGVKLRPLLLPLLDVNVNIKAHTPVGISLHDETYFTLADISQSDILGTTKSFGSGQLLGSATGALASSADVKVELVTLGIPLRLVNGLLSPILSTTLAQLQPILSAVLVPVDAIVDGLLNELGIGIGKADLTLRNVACDKIMLVR